MWADGASGRAAQGGLVWPARGARPAGETAALAADDATGGALVDAGSVLAALIRRAALGAARSGIDGTAAQGPAPVGRAVLLSETAAFLAEQWALAEETSATGHRRPARSGSIHQADVGRTLIADPLAVLPVALRRAVASRVGAGAEVDARLWHQGGKERSEGERHRLGGGLLGGSSAGLRRPRGRRSGAQQENRAGEDRQAERAPVSHDPSSPSLFRSSPQGADDAHAAMSPDSKPSANTSEKRRLKISKRSAASPPVAGLASSRI